MDQEFNPEKFLALLHAQQALLRSLISSGQQASDTVELDQSRVGRLSRMDALQAQAMSKESSRRRDLELKRIAAALERLAAGEYGYCLGCDEVIAEQRLEVDPAATLCIHCANARESGGSG